MVCKEDYELRHESDFLRVQKEKITVDFSRPEPTEDTFIGHICSVAGIYGMADYGEADCARADVFSLTISLNDEDSSLVY